MSLTSLLLSARRMTLIPTLLTGACLLAQTAPCGKSVIRPGGESTVDRFLPAPLEFVKQSTLWALPTFVAFPSQYEGNHIEARVVIGYGLRSAQKNPEFGSEGFKSGAGGTIHIDLSPATQNGVDGTRLDISFSKGRQGWAHSGRYAAPLADEVACLTTLLSPVDPLLNPRGTERPLGPPGEHRLTLKAHTPIKIALRGYLLTSELNLEDPNAGNVTFQAVEDVRVDGALVIRKGALARGKITGLSKSGHFGKGASFRLTVESVTAVDGQEIPLDVRAVEAHASSAGSDVAVDMLGAGLLGAYMTQGHDVFVRAGTTWEVPTARDATIGAEK